MRDIEIRVAQKTVFRGELEKGCGNQVFDYGKVIACNDNAKNIGATAQKPKKSKDKRSQLQVVEMMDNVSLHSDIELEHCPHQDLNEDDTLPTNITFDLDSPLRSVKDKFKQNEEVNQRLQIREPEQKHDSAKASQHTKTKGMFQDIRCISYYFICPSNCS